MGWNQFGSPSHEPCRCRVWREVASSRLVGSFFPNRGSARALAGRASSSRDSAAGRPRDDRRLRRLRHDRRMERAASRVSAPLPAVPSWGAGRALAHAVDEPDRSGFVFGLLYRLGSRGLAEPARADRDRRQDLAAQPQSPRRPGPAPSRLGLRHDRPAGARRRQAVDEKSNETTAIPILLRRIAEGGALKGAVVTIDAIACNAAIAATITDAGADYLLAVKANQRRRAPRSKPSSRTRRPPASTGSPISTRATAASRSAPSRSPARSIGSAATSASPGRAPAPRCRRHRQGRLARPC